MLKTLARVVVSVILVAPAACKKDAARSEQPAKQAEAAHAARPGPAPAEEKPGGESYTDYGVNPATSTAQDRLSTFAIDVDTASYTIARRKLVEGQLPPPESVRVEEFVNYFTYGYASPDDGAPFAIHMAAAPSPVSPGKHILRVALQARRVTPSERKHMNLVFLVDVSGSMDSEDRIGLARHGLRTLVGTLRPDDTVALVTYAGSTEIVLPATQVRESETILAAIDTLGAGGSTAMGDGLALAYQQAARHLRPGVESRVIVLSDGDANVGATSHDEILARIAGYVREGVTLSTIGFGMGNYKDTMMEQLADRGNGNYFYIDDRLQAERVFHDQASGILQTVARDVKIQVEFEPETVASYRLVGYENRDIADRDFRNDQTDAGEIGAGHSVTALYEVELTDAAGPIARVRLRHKAPDAGAATETERVLTRDAIASSFDAAPQDLRFATAVMVAAEILRHSPRAAGWRLAAAREIALAAGADSDPDRIEFVRMVERAMSLSRGEG